MSIPVYRAEVKELDYLTLNAYDLLTEIDGKMYAIGCLNIESKIEIADKKGFIYRYEIDKSTLSISFNNMLDPEGNKIFASLSEDGKFIKHIKDFK